jgi:hypothetical protein
MRNSIHMSDSQRAKSRHQHPMSNSPILLARERSEEAVVDAMSDLLEGAGDFLGEAVEKKEKLVTCYPQRPYFAVLLP